MDEKRIENAVTELLYAIGEDPTREGLLETPARVARMYGEIFAGLERDPRENLKLFHESACGEIIVLKDIPVYSMCEHHLLPFFGVAAVAYIPKNGAILGLSKVARIVDTLSRKPQLQERLTEEIAAVMEEAAEPLGVYVEIEAEHLCMAMRGIKKPGTKTRTVSARGVFKHDREKRKEVLSVIKG